MNQQNNDSVKVISHIGRILPSRLAYLNQLTIWLYNNFINGRNNVDISDLSKHFSGKLLQRVEDAALHTRGTIHVHPDPITVSSIKTNLEILPFLSKYANGHYVEQCFVSDVINKISEHNFTANYIIPSPLNPAKEVLLVTNDISGFGLVVITEHLPITFITEKQGRVHIYGANEPAVSAWVSTIHHMLSKRLDDYISAHPPLKHVNRKRQLQSFIKDNIDVHDTVTVAKYKVVTKDSIYIGPHAKGSTKKPHERESHQRVYRNADGSVRKVVKIPACKIHGGSQASGNIKINLT